MHCAAHAADLQRTLTLCPSPPSSPARSGLLSVAPHPTQPPPPPRPYAHATGSNEEGQLGLGIANASLITAAAAPLAIVNSAGSKWLTLTAGGRHTLGLSSTSAELNSVTADYTISVPVELVTKWADACRKLRSAVAVRFKALQKKKLAGYSLSLLPGDGCSSSAGGAALTHTAVYRISTDVAKLVNAMSTRKELRMVLNRSKAPCGASLSVSLVAVRTQAATAPGDGSWPGAGVPAAALMTESDMKRYRAAACKNTTAGRRRKLSL